MINKLKELREKIYMSREQPGLSLLDEIISRAQAERNNCIQWNKLRKSPLAVFVFFLVLFFIFYGIHNLLVFLFP